MKSRLMPSEGFTLIELILVVCIAGIFAGFSVPSLINWKYFQDVKTKQVALKTKLEQIKSDAKRWGAICTINGETLNSSCTSSVLQKSAADIFDLKSSQDFILNPTVDYLKEDDGGKLAGNDSFFIAANFKQISFSPRGFIHVDRFDSSEGDGVIVIGYKENKYPFAGGAPEMCVIIQHLTGQISVRQRSQEPKLHVSQDVSKQVGLTC